MLVRGGKLLLRPGVLEERMVVQSLVRRHIQPFPIFRLYTTWGVKRTCGNR